jgi:hypothetical protein
VFERLRSTGAEGRFRRLSGRPLLVAGASLFVFGTVATVIRSLRGSGLAGFAPEELALVAGVLLGSLVLWAVSRPGGPMHRSRRWPRRVLFVVLLALPVLYVTAPTLIVPVLLSAGYLALLVYGVFALKRLLFRVRRRP